MTWAEGGRARHYNIPDGLARKSDFSPSQRERTTRPLASASGKARTIQNEGGVSRKPTIARYVAADRDSIRGAIGPFFARLYSPVSDVTIYDAVLRFPSSQVI